MQAYVPKMGTELHQSSEVAKDDNEIVIPDPQLVGKL